MITEKLQNAINEQITAEMWSSNLYLAMSFYMEKEGYCGMASWLKKQSFEEHAHACELASYIIKRGGKAKLIRLTLFPTTSVLRWKYSSRFTNTNAAYQR